MEDISLSDGGQIPNIGFGTWQLQDGRETIESVLAAFETGYRLIDTAKIYGNEAGAGAAIKKSGLARKEIFITTKLWPSDFSNTRQAFEESLDRLGLDYLDLYLLHWPGADVATRQTAWQTLEEIKSDGLVKHIGVSNYMAEHLTEMTAYAQQKPVVNQIEFNPYVYNQQRSSLKISQEKGIVIEAYSPLARANNLKHSLLTEISASHSKTPAQVMLRWAIQHNTIPIPKSANKQRIKENFDVFGFKLAPEDMKQLDDLSGRGAFG